MRINHFLTNLLKISRKISKNSVLFNRVRPAYFVGGTLLFLIMYFSFLINENLKEKRVNLQKGNLIEIPVIPYKR